MGKIGYYFLSFNLGLAMLCNANAAPQTTAYKDIQNKVRSVQNHLSNHREKLNEAKEQLKELKIIQKQHLEAQTDAESQLLQIEEQNNQVAIQFEKLKNDSIQNLEKIKKVLREIHRITLINPSNSTRSDIKELRSPLHIAKKRYSESYLKILIQELETSRADLADVTQLSEKLENQRIEVQDALERIQTQKKIVKLNEQIQHEILAEQNSAKLATLKQFESLKESEQELLRLVRVNQIRRGNKFTTVTGPTGESGLNNKSPWKGQLSFPIDGKVTKKFGRYFDEKTKLFVFRKGIEIEVLKTPSVLAMGSGSIVFSGEMEPFGKTLIIDHGLGMMSVIGYLQEVIKKPGQFVKEGEVIGLAGRAVYVELREEQKPVDPELFIYPTGTNLLKDRKLTAQNLGVSK